MGVMEARRRIMLNQPHLIDASGNPISFSTDMAAKMGVKAYFSPVQKGTGDPSPQNVRPISGIQGCNVWRTGGNMFNPQLAISTAYQGENGYVNSNGSLTITMRDQSGNKQRGHVTLPPGTYDFYSEFGSGYKSRYTINDSNTETPWVGKKTVTITEQTDFYFRVAMNDSADYSYPVTGWLQIFKSGETYTEKPYSGAAYPVTFPAAGKNLLNPALKKSSGNSVCLIGIENNKADGSIVLEAGTYTLSRVLTDGRTWSEGRAVDSQGNTLARRYSDRNYISFTLQTKQAVGIYVSVFPDDYPATQSELQLESGSTATSYEPFTNTIYGGYVDYERGEVVAEWVYDDVKANVNEYSWSNTDTAEKKFANKLLPENRYKFSSAPILFTSGLVANAYNYSIYGENCANIVANSGVQGVRIGCFGCETLDAWKEYVQSQSVFGICYKLATPIHYPLTPTLIKSLKGANTIWSDMNGNLEISYWKH